MARTLLIGIDGATFDVLGPLMDDGVMPFLKAFMARGARATLMSTAHPLTPPAFVSMFTGRAPGDHGVFDFVRGEDKQDGMFFTLYDSRDIRCETIWSLAGRQGRTITSLNFVMMSPVSPVNGFVIPGMVQWKHLRRHTHPPSLYEKLKSLPWFDAKVMCWNFGHIGRAIVGDFQTDPRQWIHHHIDRETQWFRALRYLMENDPTDLVAVVFDGVDKLLHICWEFLDPQFSEKYDQSLWTEVRRMCFDYFRTLDGFLRETVEMAGPDARVFIASDHGFGPAYVTFRVNQYLNDLGHLYWKDKDEAEHNGEKDFRLDLDWARTVAYCATRSSNGIFIRIARRPGDPGIPPDHYEAFRAKLVKDLEGLCEPETGRKLVKDVLLKEETFPGPSSGNAPDITLVLFDHGMVWTSPGDKVVERKSQVKGTHYPEGILVAAGPGIKEGVSLDDLSILDVAPTLLYSLGLPIPENFAKLQPAPVFNDEFLKTNPVVIGESARERFDEAQAPSASTHDDVATQAEKVVYAQLRALGYVD